MVRTMSVDKLDEIFLKKIEKDFLLENRLCVVRYYNEEMSLCEVTSLLKDRHREFLRVSLTRRANFIETCKFLVLFQHLKGATSYRNMLEYVSLIQSIRGLWIIEPLAVQGDGDVISDFITEPTIYGVSATYAGRWHRDAKTSFEKAWPLIARSSGIWGHGYEAFGLTLTAIRLFDKAGILNSEYAKCNALNQLKNWCIKTIENKMEEFLSGKPRISWSGESVDRCVEILYRLGYNREYLQNKLEEFREIIKKLPNGIRNNEYHHRPEIKVSVVLLRNSIKPEDIIALKQEVLWLPLEKMEIKNTKEILKIVRSWPHTPRIEAIVECDPQYALFRRISNRTKYLEHLYRIYTILRRISEVDEGLIEKAIRIMEYYCSEGDI